MMMVIVVMIMMTVMMTMMMIMMMIIMMILMGDYDVGSAHFTAVYRENVLFTGCFLFDC